FAGAVDFFEQGLGADRHAAGEDAQGVLVEDAGGEEVELEGFSARDDGVPGVVAAAVANDIGGFVAEDVDDFAFGFIAPLGADDDEGGHSFALFFGSGRGFKTKTGGAFDVGGLGPPHRGSAGF